MSTKALNCPFCGQKPRFSFIPANQPDLPRGFYSLTCHRKSNRCPAMPMAQGDTKEEALVKWNTRDTGRKGETNYRDGAGRTLQPIALDADGVARFKKNAIVNFLHEKGGFDMNALARMEFSDDDRMQFAQLIGYSTSGFGELGYVPLHVADVADDVADRLGGRKTKAKKEGA
ncbi:MAG: hypothetical protein H7067_03770 [Burkholderiales bacterium]|nr:hypothetical protein [Opitutaceae bacterium]